jgi:GNAT superfamily N-acetyltransferase
VRIAEYGPDRRADVAALMERVWGALPAEAELAWMYESSPVRPASVLLGEEDGRLVGVVAMSFLRMSIGGAELVVGMPVGLATDPAHRGRGVFQTLQRANEERARETGIRLLLIVPNAASAAVLVWRLGWTKLPSLRVWVRGRLLRARCRRAPAVERLPSPVTQCHEQSRPGDRVLRDAAYLEWRFGTAPRPYLLLDGGDGYAVCGRRGRVGVVAAVSPKGARGDLLEEVAAATEQRLLIAAPPPTERRRYALAGYLPTPRTFTVLGKSLHPEQPLPPRPHFELGDLDFF